MINDPSPYMPPADPKEVVTAAEKIAEMHYQRNKWSGDRLALADLHIRWDSDGSDDVILGVVPILGNFARELATSAAYALNICVKMIGDDHPRPRPVCRRISLILINLGLA